MYQCTHTSTHINIHQHTSTIITISTHQHISVYQEPESPLTTTDSECLTAVGLAAVGLAAAIFPKLLAKTMWDPMFQCHKMSSTPKSWDIWDGWNMFKHVQTCSNMFKPHHVVVPCLSCLGFPHSARWMMASHRWVHWGRCRWFRCRWFQSITLVNYWSNPKGPQTWDLVGEQRFWPVWNTSWPMWVSWKKKWVSWPLWDCQLSSFQSWIAIPATSDTSVEPGIPMASSFGLT